MDSTFNTVQRGQNTWKQRFNWITSAWDPGELCQCLDAEFAVTPEQLVTEWSIGLNEANRVQLSESINDMKKRTCAGCLTLFILMLFASTHTCESPSSHMDVIKTSRSPSLSDQCLLTVCESHINTKPVSVACGSMYPASVQTWICTYLKVSGRFSGWCRYDLMLWRLDAHGQQNKNDLTQLLKGSVRILCSG